MLNGENPTRYCREVADKRREASYPRQQVRGFAASASAARRDESLSLQAVQRPVQRASRRVEPSTSTYIYGAMSYIVTQRTAEIRC